MTAAANPRCQLAPRTPSHPCALSPLNTFSNALNIILKSNAPCSLCDRLINFHHRRRKINSQKTSTRYPTLFNIHNPNQDHRDHGACGFLLTS